jgi:hypothetical protein
MVYLSDSLSEHSFYKFSQQPLKLLPQLTSNGYYMSVINLLNIQTMECVHIIQNFIFHSEHFDMVIELGMGKSSKKKPMTKKERAEKKKSEKKTARNSLSYTS